ncbi:NAD binding domain of 6-phosphogluconate dehydrogenase-domain-containing protein [Kalaharituber pfeilii]|nr:NAD binding domain of 6-phosphogluconate dehydrogenase-domain-containing protein [Kalaharituber pfeilii]
MSTLRLLTQARLLPPYINTQRHLSTTRSLNKTYAFVGLGQMGYPMAQNLLRGLTRQDTLLVYDVRPEPYMHIYCSYQPRICGGKAVAARDLEDVVMNADAVMTMLPESKHVEGAYGGMIDVWLKAGRKADQGRKLFVDSSTIDIATSVSVGKSVRESGLGTFYDAPVSGGVVGAKAATLTFMLGGVGAGGGTDATVDPKTLLASMAGRVLPCGTTPGSGLAAKLTNNYLLAISNVAVSEAMNLGLRLGLDEATLKAVINSSSGRCWASEVNNPVDREKTDFKGGFGIGLMKKDLKLAREAARQYGAGLALGEKVEEVYSLVEGKGEGYQGRDFAVVYKWLKEGGEKLKD